MSSWANPVRKCGDVLVFGERHRESTSRDALFEMWDSLDGEIGGVCAEVGPSVGLRDDGGGAIGGALSRAEAADIPRYYVDEPIDDVIEAFGGRFSAYSYLKSLEDRVPKHSDGLIEQEICTEVREEVRTEYGTSAYELLFTNREEKMAKRAKWVASQVEGTVVLIVGAAHLDAIASILEADCDGLPIQDSRKRTGDRFGANMGPWDMAITMTWISCKELYSALKERIRKDHGETTV